MLFSKALLVCLILVSDAPLSIYGQSGGVLSDSGGGSGSVSSIALYGMLGDGCVDNKDCFVDNSVCNDKGKCSCLPDFTQTPGNSGSCQGKRELEIRLHTQGNINKKAGAIMMNIGQINKWPLNGFRLSYEKRLISFLSIFHMLHGLI